MKSRIPILVISAVLFSLFLFSNPQEDLEGLIFPDPGEKICLVQAAERDGEYLAGKKLDEDDPLAKMIREQLDLPYHRSMIKLSQCARNLAADDMGPNVLFLSRTEGGFPRQGLIIQENGRSEKFPDLYFVDLALDEGRIARGDLDIYTHELGHVMMLNILGEDIPDSRSVKQHVSMGITDYSTAFFEGWGVHFQRLAYDNVPLYRQSYLSSFDPARDYAHSWHSNIDKSLRLNGVLENMYVHRRLLPAVDLSGKDAEEMILLEHTSPVFDRTRLKNAQQMLSCEGVLATLFYRIGTDAVLQNNFREKSFYEPFLLAPIPPAFEPGDVFTPLENVFLKQFYVWDKIKKRLTPDSAIFLEFLGEWGDSFPEDRPEIFKIFLMTTLGKTVFSDLGKTYETMSYHGMIGDYQTFRKLAAQLQKETSSLIQKVLEGQVTLDANLGPQIWVTNKDFLIRTTLWNPENKKPLSINLNTASPYDLASFPKVGLDRAKELLEKREELGYFKSLEQAKNLGFRTE